VGAVLFWAGAWGCGDGGGNRIAGPDLPEGPGRVYPIRSVSFPSVDQVQVSALMAQPAGGQGLRPAVVLVHDLFSDKSEWLFLFERLLQRGYLPLAIDLRGHGDTPFPDDGRAGPFLVVDDVENSYLDVQAALTWLRSQSGVDIARVAVVGNGGGANVAFMSSGAFPRQVKTAVAVSPGVWDRDRKPIAVGTQVQPFSPQSILFMVGSDDVVVTQDGS
jgi:dienelactone hydrolase